MNKFFVSPEAISGEWIRITGQDLKHMRNVLRLRPGESVYVGDGCEREYVCVLDRFTQEQALLRIVDVNGESRELASRLILFQAMPKGDKLETIIQKAVELGAYEIVPMVTKRTVVKWEEKKLAKKVERWNAIAQAAAKQSKRNWIPQVRSPISFSEAVHRAAALSGAILPYENAQGMDQARATVKALSGKESVGILIGPEGGFSQDEVEQAAALGIAPITLGHRILRTETAGMAVLSILMFAMERDVAEQSEV